MSSLYEEENLSFSMLGFVQWLLRLRWSIHTHNIFDEFQHIYLDNSEHVDTYIIYTCTLLTHHTTARALVKCVVSFDTNRCVRVHLCSMIDNVHTVASVGVYRDDHPSEPFPPRPPQWTFPHRVPPRPTLSSCPRVRQYVIRSSIR